MDIPYYPKTSHLFLSKEKDNLESSDKSNFSHLEGKKVVIEEKVDAQAIGIFFHEDILHLLFRGQYFCPEKNHQIPKELKNCYAHFKLHEELFYEIIQNDKIIYGEWMEYTHTVNYDKLPSFFLEYDIYCRENKLFLSTNKRHELLKPFPEITSVHIHQISSPFNFDDFKNIINNNKLSKYGNNLLQEGFYIKVEDEVQVLDRFKWIEPKFIHSVTSSKHWREKPLQKNKLRF